MLIANHAAVFDKYLRYQMIALSYRGEVASLSTGSKARTLNNASSGDVASPQSWPSSPQPSSSAA
jgi:hypothetical protein